MAIRHRLPFSVLMTASFDVVFLSFTIPNPKDWAFRRLLMCVKKYPFIFNNKLLSLSLFCFFVFLLSGSDGHLQGIS